jgi:sterol 3beta-glucosyltransferase
MNILILTLGTRGDVQPYVAFGKGLQAAGHAVTLCTSCSFAALVTAHGLPPGAAAWGPVTDKPDTGRRA